MWTYWIVDAFTGEKRQQVHPSAGPWRTVANSVGSGQAAFQLKDQSPAAVIPRATLRDLFRPWANVYVVCWAGVPVYAGFVISADYSKRTGVLLVKHSELRVIMRGRYQYFIYFHDPAGAFKVTARSLRGAARAVLQLGLNRGVGGDWDLPVVFEADEAGSEDRTWFAHRFQSTEQMLAEVQNEDGGPEVHLQPRWNDADRLEWLARVGSPKLSGEQLTLNADASSGLLDVSELLDGTKQLTGIWTQGEGSEVDMRLGRAGDIPGEFSGPRIPNMDLPRPTKTLTDQALLDSTAREIWRTNRAPTRQLGFSVLASVALPSTVVGSDFNVWIGKDDPWLEPGYARGRIIGLSGEVGSPSIGLEFQ